MRKENRFESDQERVERKAKAAIDGAAEEKALDAAVRRSIKLHGA